jgi:hypothetical protein
MEVQANLVSRVPVAMYVCVSGSTSGLILSAARAFFLIEPAMRSSASSSGSDSTFKSRMSFSSANRISSSVLPTPAKTVFFGSPPALRTRKSSPPETTSNPLPCSCMSRRIERLELAFTE